MTRSSGGPATDQGGAYQPAQERGGESAGSAGDAAEEGEKPSPGDRGETSSDDGPASAIDIDSTRDRAS